MAAPLRLTFRQHEGEEAGVGAVQLNLESFSHLWVSVLKNCQLEVGGWSGLLPTFAFKGILEALYLTFAYSPSETSQSSPHLVGIGI